MENDLIQIIAGWEHNPQDFSKNVRQIRGIDGREKIQLRTELGLSQMELEGRPDGKRPAGFPSVLDWVCHRMREHRQRGLPPEVFRLDDADVERLQRESLQYQLRGACLLAMENREKAIRNIEHTIAITRLLSCHAPDEETRTQHRQLVPHLLLERTRVKVVFHVSQGDATEAAREIVEQIQREDREGRANASPSLTALQEMAEEVRRKYLAR